jgi:hypothetical protein
MARSISLIRHGEKQIGDALPQGVSVDGNADTFSMTPRGWQRAGALVGLFVDRPDGSAPALLPTPTHLFASEVGPSSHSRRPEETLMPIAARLGLTIAESYLPDQVVELANAIAACDGHVLVAWEHKRIPLIAARLVADPSTVPKVWPDDRYDIVWIIEPDPDRGDLRLRQVPQSLLAGDRPEPIA